MRQQLTGSDYGTGLVTRSLVQNLKEPKDIGMKTKMKPKNIGVKTKTKSEDIDIKSKENYRHEDSALVPTRNFVSTSHSGATDVGITPRLPDIGLPCSGSQWAESIIA